MDRPGVTNPNVIKDLVEYIDFLETGILGTISHLKRCITRYENNGNYYSADGARVAIATIKQFMRMKEE